MENKGEGTEEARMNVVESLTSSMNEELAALANEMYTVCIFGVSEKYRRLKEDCTPRVISIGPLHYGDSHLQAMEAYKLRYLHDFLTKFEVGIDKLVSYASRMEVLVRACYEDTTKIKSKEFCRMILLDGVFIVQLFIKNLIHMREPGDMLFENRWMASDLMHDMLLLENQLPIFFISVIFELVDPGRVCQKSFHELAFEYFKTLGNSGRLELTPHCQQSRHLVEFLLNLHRPSNRQHQPPETSFNGSISRFRCTKSASELHEAGVRFITGIGQLFEVSFKVGRLYIPRLTVNDKTETFFRNLIAFEQFGHHEKYMTTYIIFMFSLANTAADVELLVEYGIIDNRLGKNQLVVDLLNNVHKDIIEDQRDFYFAKICNDLDGYNRDYIHGLKSAWWKWKWTLINVYFSDPWSLISLMVIGLTFIQTVCAIVGLVDYITSNSKVGRV